MAVYTKVSRAEASSLGGRYELGDCLELTEVAKGSVNTNYLARFEHGPRFVRLYEDQDTTGVAYEWALLTHLSQAGVTTPCPDTHFAPGEVRLHGLPVAVFPVVPGDETCQAKVTAERARALGVALGEVHRAVADFGWRRAARFGFAEVSARRSQVEATGRPELIAWASRACEALEHGEGAEASLPRGVIHGDLFRDNVRWDDDEPTRITGLLDWESAADGTFAFDLAVTMLAWCFGATFDSKLARAMVEGYESVRALSDAEWDALPALAAAAAARFTLTRITDFELRQSTGARVEKDWRRFAMRLAAVESLSDSFVGLLR